MNFVDLKKFANKTIIIVPDVEHNKYLKVRRLVLGIKEYSVSDDVFSELTYILDKYNITNGYLRYKYIFNFILPEDRDVIYTSYLDNEVVDKINTHILITDMFPNEYDIQLKIIPLSYNYSIEFNSTVTNLSGTEVKLIEPIDIYSKINSHLKCVTFSNKIRKYVNKTMLEGSGITIPTLVSKFRCTLINDILN